MSRNFLELLKAKWAEGKFVCVGLDSEFDKIPESARRSGNECDVSVANTLVAFNREIVEATKDTVCAYKPNIAFYEAHGDEGVGALQRTIADIHSQARDIPVILDYKRADIGNTNTGYVQAAFDYFRADAVTVHPYLGREALKPFLDRQEKGIIVLCRTSNKGAGEFQDREIVLGNSEGMEFVGAQTVDTSLPSTVPLYQYVAWRTAKHWNSNGNCAVVAGATYPEELGRIRKIVGDMPILIPGIGKQGGDVEKTVRAGKDSRGEGMIINSSSGIVFASNGPDFAEAARRETLKLHKQINQYRQGS